MSECLKRELESCSTTTETDGDLQKRKAQSSPLTLTTIVTVGMGAPEREGSVNSTFAKYRTSPITFEDFFQKRNIQRRFYSNLIRFQIVLNFSAASVSLFCTILTDTAWFWNGGDDLLNALLLHTGILSIMMLFLPFFMQKLRKWKSTSHSIHILRVLHCIYQASLATFWLAFALGKFWKFPEDDRKPILFLPFSYFTLNFVTLCAIFAILRCTSIEKVSYVTVAISLAVSSVFLVTSLPLIHLQVIGRGFVILDSVQAAAASCLSILECSLTFCFFTTGRHPPVEENSVAEVV